MRVRPLRVYYHELWNSKYDRFEFYLGKALKQISLKPEYFMVPTTIACYNSVFEYFCVSFKDTETSCTEIINVIIRIKCITALNK